ncbi:type II toxin-antitoxin system RelE/ParE family toxin [Candidatus Odyssella thessalonicensis]|uniref:type II toxin-antitoxin system RelE/ParE family toxin n=1 Tax=Candidatus Odyssella thessalonicensis TaxID=84647 RepID=UPI000225BDA3|nr:hypothetical protein [Candidatus Odyssella thessalonicensis]
MGVKLNFFKALPFLLLTASPSVYASSSLTVAEVNNTLERYVRQESQKDSHSYQAFAQANARVIREIHQDIELHVKRAEQEKKILEQFKNQLPSHIKSDNITTIFGLFVNIYGDIKHIPLDQAQKDLYRNPEIYYRYMDKLTDLPSSTTTALLFIFSVARGNDQINQKRYSAAIETYRIAYNYAEQLEPIIPGLFECTLTGLLKYFVEASEIEPTEYPHVLAVYHHLRKTANLTTVSLDEHIMLSNFYCTARNYRKTIKHAHSALKILIQERKKITEDILQLQPQAGELIARERLREGDNLLKSQRLYQWDDAQQSSQKLLDDLNSLILRLEHNLAISFYYLNKPERANDYLDQIYNFNKDTIQTDPDYFILRSVVYARLERWNDSFNALKTAFTLRRRGLEQQAQDEDELLIIETLLRNKGEHPQEINHLLNYMTSYKQELAQDISRIASKISHSQLTEFKINYLNKLAKNLFEEARNHYLLIDQYYLRYWKKQSFETVIIPEHLYKKLDEQFSQGYQLYQELKKLKSADNYASFIKKIRQLVEELRIVKDKLFMEVALFGSNLKTLLLKKQRTAPVYSFIQDTFIDNVANRHPEQHHDPEAEETENERQQRLIRKEQRQQERLYLKEAYEKSLQGLKQNHNKGEAESSPSVPHMIRSLKKGITADIWSTKNPGTLPYSTLELLQALDMAQSTYHLRHLVPTNARIELLKGKRKGQISLRTNDHFRICFRWVAGEGAYEVEITDHYKAL